MAWLRNFTRHDPNFAHATLDDENNVVRPEEMIGVFSTVEAATFSIITRRKLGEIGKSERRLTSCGEKYYKWIGPRKVGHQGSAMYRPQTPTGTLRRVHCFFFQETPRFEVGISPRDVYTACIGIMLPKGASWALVEAQSTG
jgi:hypothetical protein